MARAGWTPVWSGRVDNEGWSLIVAFRQPDSRILMLEEHTRFETHRVILTPGEIEELFGGVRR